jgi:hypothetical protein
MKSQHKALKSYRLRQKRQGIARVEVQIPRQDADLVRDIAKTLRDPARAEALRLLLRTQNPYRGMSFKELLMSAPLEGVDLTRPLDYGRDVEL